MGLTVKEIRSPRDSLQCVSSSIDRHSTLQVSWQIYRSSKNFLPANASMAEACSAFKSYPSSPRCGFNHPMMSLRSASHPSGRLISSSSSSLSLSNLACLGFPPFAQTSTALHRRLPRRNLCVGKCGELFRRRMIPMITIERPGIHYIH
jgi:hypothetical protein